MYSDPLASGRTRDMRFFTTRILTRALLLATAMLALSGCVLAPKDTARETRRFEQSGNAYAQTFDQRSLPELSPQPTWMDVLHRAFLANGDLEARYFEWSA